MTFKFSGRGYAATLALVIATVVSACSENTAEVVEAPTTIAPPEEPQPTPKAQLHPMMSPDLAEFSDHPAALYDGPRAKPVLDAKNRDYRTVINGTSSRPVDFAGSTVIATFGCGNACQSGYIVDAKTGKVDRLAANGSDIAFLDLNHRADSRLLVAAWAGAYSSETTFTCHYQRYIWNGQSLQALGEEIVETRSDYGPCDQKPE